MMAAKPQIEQQTKKLKKMHKTATVTTRIDPKLKIDAESILEKVGLTSAEAVRLLYKQICLHRGLPFEAKIPNTTTLKAMKDADDGNTKSINNLDDLFEDL